MIGTAAIAIATAGIGFYGAPLAQRLLAVRRLQRWCTRHGVLVLTFDDGPGQRLTPAILALLRRRGAHATFFPLGQRRRPEVLDLIRRSGHEVGWHGDRHLHAWKTAPWATMRDLHDGHRLLKPWLDEPPLYRPPYGKLHAGAQWSVRRRGGRLGWWTVDSRDTAQRLPSHEKVVQTVARRRGGVVLLHDFDRTSERDDYVIETTERLLHLARAKRIRIRRLGDVIRSMSERRSSAPAAHCT